MNLVAIEIENFRGIRRLAVPLEATTALFGENDSGKSSVLDLLAAVLGVAAPPGPPRFLPSDFHRSPDSDSVPELRIRLRWRGGGEPDPLSTGLGHAAFRHSGSHQATVEITAPGGDAPAAPVEGRLRFLDAGDAPIEGVDHDAAFAVLRRLRPVILLAADRSAIDPQAAVSIDPNQRLLHEFAQTAAETPWQLDHGDVARGIAAAESIIGRGGLRNWRFQPDADADDAANGDPSETPLSLAPRVADVGFRSHGAGSRRIAAIMMVENLLAARGNGPLDDDARTLVAIEEPESHLHPIMLSAVWGLLEHVRARKILTTNSGELLASVSLRSLRRLVRERDGIACRTIDHDRYDSDEKRRIGYHVRVQRAGSLFARAWLLIEGETEFWLMPEIARQLGYDLRAEGVWCVEFAQCGVEPLVKVANDLGIAWHLVADGDRAGATYAQIARRHLGDHRPQDRITVLREADIEHCLWESGYAPAYLRAAHPSAPPETLDPKKANPKKTIRLALKLRSKPGMALEVLDAIGAEGSPGVPVPLRNVIERIVHTARGEAAPRRK